MVRKSSLQELQNIMSDYEGSILYKPIKNEIDYTNRLFPLKLKTKKIILPTNKNTNPFLWANKCLKTYKNTNPYILIPGTQFDIYGTRHGKGGGWYDRFLSKIPNTWLKIGVAHQSQMSIPSIKKEPWDISMDWLLVFNNESCNAYRTQTIKKPAVRSVQALGVKS
jgi:5,10-methenyltetrahydrofolate synthetase